jgi:hypothetical protein
MRVHPLLVMLLALTSCTPPATPAPPSLPPPLLTPCEIPVVEPPPPPRPRTVDGIAEWGTRTQYALRLANQRLRTCERHRAEALRLLIDPPTHP